MTTEKDWYGPRKMRYLYSLGVVRRLVLSSWDQICSRDTENFVELELPAVLGKHPQITFAPQHGHEVVDFVRPPVT